MAPGKVEVHNEQMPKVDLKTDVGQLKDTDVIFMKRIHSLNLARVKNLKETQKRSRAIGLTLTSMALGIYAYTFYAIKQEKFLDDFDEPEMISRPVQGNN